MRERDKETEIETDRQRQTETVTEKEGDRQTDKQTDMQKQRETSRQMNCQIDRKREKQKKRQIKKQTRREGKRERKKKHVYFIHRLLQLLRVPFQQHAYKRFRMLIWQCACVVQRIPVTLMKETKELVLILCLGKASEFRRLC